ncbi:beta-lactamase/D-alanine carboxypeptidase [Phycisphaerae bacterium RAS1]|nr:beta-lactamase/D-alanine carboxypeptidase [Phycisphaerae bacterium RAS1]
MTSRILLAAFIGICALGVGQRPAGAQTGHKLVIPPVGVEMDSDHDGLIDTDDDCPNVLYLPLFDWTACAPMDLNPANDPQPECRARERVANLLMTDPTFVTQMSFAVVKEGRLHFADAFNYVGDGQFVRDASGVHRLYRIGSTTKSIVAVAAKAMEERGQLSLGDYVSDEDGTQAIANPQRTLRHLLTHQGAFRTDYGAIHLFCYDGDLAAFWLDPDDVVSPHYNSAQYGNLGGGYQYSAFNYSLAGAYLAHRAGRPLATLLQRRVFNKTGMCTATLDGTRAANSPIGNGWGVSETATMHVGPYVNYYSQFDPRCADNYYSSDDLPGDAYSWQVYRIDEAAAEARDPAGGVIASVIDLAHFAESLLASYHGRGGLLSPAGIRDLWAATTDLGCSPNCPYERYYGIGFFTSSLPGQPVVQVGHGGARPGFATAFVLRPQSDAAVCIFANADVSTQTLSNLAKTILDDFAD